MTNELSKIEKQLKALLLEIEKTNKGFSEQQIDILEEMKYTIESFIYDYT